MAQPAGQVEAQFQDALAEDIMAQPAGQIEAQFQDTPTEDIMAQSVGHVNAKRLDPAGTSAGIEVTPIDHVLPQGAGQTVDYYAFLSSNDAMFDRRNINLNFTHQQLAADDQHAPFDFDNDQSIDMIFDVDMLVGPAEGSSSSTAASLVRSMPQLQIFLLMLRMIHD